MFVCACKRHAAAGHLTWARCRPPRPRNHSAKNLGILPVLWVLCTRHGHGLCPPPSLHNRCHHRQNRSGRRPYLCGQPKWSPRRPTEPRLQQPRSQLPSSKRVQGRYYCWLSSMLRLCMSTQQIIDGCKADRHHIQLGSQPPVRSRLFGGRAPKRKNTWPAVWNFLKSLSGLKWCDTKIILYFDDQMMSWSKQLIFARLLNGLNVVNT